MSRSFSTPRKLAVSLGLVTAVLAAPPALAQPPARAPRIPVDAKGYQAGLILAEAARRPAPARPAPAQTVRRPVGRDRRGRRPATVRDAGRRDDPGARHG